MAIDYTAPNMALWARVEPTDPTFVKPITGKQYKGSSPNPHWVKQRLTEVFGPAGSGWGVRVLDQQFITVGSTMMHYVTIELWYILDGKRCAIEECGGTQLGGVRKSGEPFADEDAPKKSVTDAVVKAASAIGFCADIFLGRWDDSKYVEQREQDERVARSLGAAQLAAEAAKAQAELIGKVGALVDVLRSVTVEEAFASCRAEAMDLRVRLKQAGLDGEIARLGDAVTEAKTRIAPGASRKVA